MAMQRVLKLRVGLVALLMLVVIVLFAARSKPAETPSQPPSPPAFDHAKAVKEVRQEGK